jgi:hypothetical protein
MTRKQGILLSVLLVIAAGVGVGLWLDSRPLKYNVATPTTTSSIPPAKSTPATEPETLTVGGVTVLATPALCTWALSPGHPMSPAVAASFVPVYSPSDLSDKRAGRFHIALESDSAAFKAACAG